MDDNTFSIIVDGNTVSYFIRLDDGTEKHLIDFPIAKDQDTGKLYVPLDCFYTLINLVDDGWNIDKFVLEKTEKGD